MQQFIIHLSTVGLIGVTNRGKGGDRCFKNIIYKKMADSMPFFVLLLWWKWLPVLIKLSVLQHPRYVQAFSCFFFVLLKGSWMVCQYYAGQKVLLVRALRDGCMRFKTWKLSSPLAFQGLWNTTASTEIEPSLAVTKHLQLQPNLLDFPEGFLRPHLIYLWPKSGSWPRLWHTLMSLIKGQIPTWLLGPEPWEPRLPWREATVQMETHSLHPISPGMCVCVWQRVLLGARIKGEVCLRRAFEMDTHELALCQTHTRS